jgi:hypothetical protein
MILLRFRDLTVPDGQTVARHQSVIDSRDSVWWGWIMRQDEIFPSDFIMSLAERLESDRLEEVLLLHSGTSSFYRAEVAAVSALPDGTRVRSPELHLTPSYMHESVCPAWFELRNIIPYAAPSTMVVRSTPTLPEPASFDVDLLKKQRVSAAELRNSGATMWDITVIP